MFIVSGRGLGAACAGLGILFLVGTTAACWIQPAGAAEQTAPNVGGAELASPDEQPVDPSIARAAQLETEVNRLTAQLDALTKRLDDVERKAKEPVKAPFVVVDAQGAPMFSVTREGAGVSVLLNGAYGNVTLSTVNDSIVKVNAGENFAVLSSSADATKFFMESPKGLAFAGQEGDGMKMYVDSKQDSAGILALPSGPSVYAKQGGRIAELGATDPTFGFAASLNGARTVALGDKGDGTYSLRVYKAGGSNPVVQAGVLESGNPALVIGDGARQFARIEGKDGDGVLTAFKAGQEAVTVGKIDERTGLSVKVGADVVSAVLGGSEGPSFGLQAGDKSFFSVDRAGGNARLQLDQDGKKKIDLQANTPSMGVEDGDRLVFMGTGKSTGFYVNDSGGKTTRTFMGLGSEGPLTALFSSSGGRPLLSAAIDGSNRPGFYLTGGEKIVGSLATKDGTLGELTLSDGSGEVAKMGALAGSGTLALSKGGTPTLTMGPTEAKPLPAFRAYDGGKMVMAAGATTLGTGAVVAYGGDTVGAGMEGASGGGGSVYVTKGGQPVASVTSSDNPGQGLVVIRNAGGTPIATLGSASGGGGNVTTMDPSGNGVFSAGYTSDGPGTACVEHKGTKCLGVGLTGMEGFH